jgi:hypothetical protein
MKVKLAAAISSLPPVNRALFGTVTRLLKDVVRLPHPLVCCAGVCVNGLTDEHVNTTSIQAAHEKANFMSPDNLGIVWGPTLLREEKENFMSMELPVSVIISLIKYCDDLFGTEVGPASSLPLVLPRNHSITDIWWVSSSLRPP